MVVVEVVDPTLEAEERVALEEVEVLVAETRI